MNHRIALFVSIASLAIWTTGCEEVHKTTSDDIQQQRQENVLKEAVAQCGVPNIKNFREMRMLKEVYELRDQANLTTYMYMENVVPKVVVGHTCCGGKLTFIRESIGYGIPAATQYTNPQKVERFSVRKDGYDRQCIAIPQADPNGLFSPASADGTWIMMYDEKAGKAVPQYAEPRILVFTFKMPFDTAEDLKASSMSPDGLVAEKR